MPSETVDSEIHLYFSLALSLSLSLSVSLCLSATRGGLLALPLHRLRSLSLPCLAVLFSRLRLGRAATRNSMHFDLAELSF